MWSATDDLANRQYAIYVLGAGFSKPAGLPLANELWSEVYRRASILPGRMGQFREDLVDFIEFKLKCDGIQLTPQEVDFEEFLGFLDVEYHLNLRGSDTWSTDGNEAQVVAKTLIGQVLAERMPSRETIPSLYLNFARKLKPGDTILTFNYDVVLERAMALAGVPFRLFPFRYTRVYSSGGGEIEWNRDDEVVILKLHGSIDWFDRNSFKKREAIWKQQGISDRPEDPVFNGPRQLSTVPLIDGPSHESDPLHEMHRLVDFERLYVNPPWFMAVPTLINPSTAKVIFAGQFSDFWSGLGRTGGGNYKLVIIGFSMPQHDDYARQVIYRLTKNYQEIHYHPHKPKAPILLVDYRETVREKDQLLKRYAFLDPTQSEFNFEGFTQSIVDRL
jgi:SIR2-like domain